MANYQRSSKSSSGGPTASMVVFLLVLAFIAAGVAKSFHVGGVGSTTSQVPYSTVSGRLLADAKQYDSVSYVWGGGHDPKNYHKGDGVDCSGLIDMAVYDVTKTAKSDVVSDFPHDSHWKKINPKDVQPGDVLYLIRSPIDDSHIVFVDSYTNGKLVVFEAYGTQDKSGSIPADNQVRQSDGWKLSQFTGALRFVG